MKPTNLLLAALVLWSAGPSCWNDHPSAYETDVQAIENELAKLEDQTMGRAVLLGRRGNLMGTDQDLVAAASLVASTVRRAIDSGQPCRELCLAGASLGASLHRTEEARRYLGWLSDPDRWRQAGALSADLALAEGDLVQAEQAYTRSLAGSHSWETLARLSHVKQITGEVTRADDLLAEAEDQLSSKEMRAFAWLEVQRARLDFARGRFSDARAHYERAGRAYSGYWLVQAGQAELAAAEGKLPEAIAAYERLERQTSRPGVMHALGDLYAFAQRPADAKRWHEKALAAYSASVQRGDVHYLHHLASYHADVSGDGAEAVKWAEADLALRPALPAALETLAWALYRAGRQSEALATIRKALATGASSAHLSYRAGLIHLAAGEGADGARHLRLAAQMNPFFQSTFHAHD